jgi:hypothetical protein
MRSNDSAKRAAHIEEPLDKNFVHHNEPSTGKGYMRAAMLQSVNRKSSLYRRRKKKATADVCFVKLVQKGPVPSGDKVKHLTSCKQAVLRTSSVFPRHKRAQKSRISIVFFILIRPNEQKSYDVLVLQGQAHISLYIFLTARLLCAAMKKKKCPFCALPFWVSFCNKPFARSSRPMLNHTSKPSSTLFLF